MFKVKIIKCSKPVFWYNDKIGKIYNAESKDDTLYIINNYNLGMGHYVYIDDVIIWDRVEKLDKLINRIKNGN